MELSIILFFSFKVHSSVIEINIGTIPIGLTSANKDEKHKTKNSKSIFIYILSLAVIPSISIAFRKTILNESIKNNREFVMFLSSVIILFFA